MSQWSQCPDIGQLQRMQEETPGQIGHNRPQRAQFKDHLRLNQRATRCKRQNLKFTLLHKDHMLSQPVNTICSLTFPKMPLVMFSRRIKTFRARCQKTI